MHLRSVSSPATVLEKIASGAELNDLEQIAAIGYFDTMKRNGSMVIAKLSDFVNDFDRDMAIELRNYLSHVPGTKGGIQTKVGLLYDYIHQNGVDEEASKTAKDILVLIDRLNERIEAIEKIISVDL